MGLAQGILCGSWALAFPFEGARQIIEDFELAAVPKASPWMVGAANVDGNIYPVIDLAIYLESSAPTMNERERLLVLTLHDGSNEDSIALRFQGLPQQLSYEKQVLTYASALPARLREICVGVGKDRSGREFLEISIPELFAALGDALSSEAV